MKKIINQRKYDTDTAKALATYETDLAIKNNAYYAATLYRKRNGEYFLYGKGNAGSPYSEMVDGAFIPGEKITPLTVTQAKSWAQDRTDADTYEAIFGPVDEGEDMKNLHVQIDADQYRQLKDRAAEDDTSVAGVIRSAIWEYLK